MESDRAEALLDSAAVSLKSIVADLVQHGALDLLVPNLPDLGMTPRVLSQGAKPMAAARRLTEYFNNAVERAIEPFTSVRFYRLDVWSMAEQARRDPVLEPF
jgi:outer membrane lipase/esterase